MVIFPAAANQLAHVRVVILGERTDVPERRPTAKARWFAATVRVELVGQKVEGLNGAEVFGGGLYVLVGIDLLL